MTKPNVKLPRVIWGDVKILVQSTPVRYTIWDVITKSRNGRWEVQFGYSDPVKGTRKTLEPTLIDHAIKDAEMMRGK